MIASRARPWLWAAPLVLALGLLSGALSGSGAADPWFAALAKPWFMPPGWAFPVVWTILYLMMGVALGLLVAARAWTAIAWFGVQLALNLAWSPLFFGAHRVAVALALIAALDAAVAVTIVAAVRARPLAALLLVPYAAWLALASALNLAILRLNP